MSDQQIPDCTPLHCSFNLTALSIGYTLHEVYNPIALQPLPMRFGKALGEVFLVMVDFVAVQRAPSPER